MWKRVSGIAVGRSLLKSTISASRRIFMHTWLTPSLLGRGIASVRRLLSRDRVVMLALFAILIVVSSPMAFGQGQGQTPASPQATPQPQPGSIANPQPGAVVQEHVANPPGNVPSHAAGGEANLKLPDMASVSFLDGSINGYKLLALGIIFCFLGGLFGLVIYMQLKNLPVHRTMREISELIYETCKTYLTTQGKFILVLEAFIAVVIVLYFGLLLKFETVKVVIILLF